MFGHAIFSSFIIPTELAATSMLDFFLQQTLETNCPLLSKLFEWPEMGLFDSNLWEAIGTGRDLW
jgi:hypothetical protein